MTIEAVVDESQRKLLKDAVSEKPITDQRSTIALSSAKEGRRRTSGNVIGE
jgi:hypothetical protein